jgi:hypothetical protein
MIWEMCGFGTQVTATASECANSYDIIHHQALTTKDFNGTKNGIK